MATSTATAARPAVPSPATVQRTWSGSPGMQSPALPHHQGPGVGPGATSFFDSRPPSAAVSVLPQQPNGTRHVAQNAPSPLTVGLPKPSAHPTASAATSPGMPSAASPVISSTSNPGVPPQSEGPAAPISSDTASEQPQASDKSHTEQYTEIADLIKTTDRSVLRQAIRDHWDLCLLGSEYNLAFFLNAILHQASPDVLRRSVQDFGSRLVQAALPQIIPRCEPAELDQVADQLLSKLSTNFLDRALARRLETIDARSLVNALARAERLGYDVSDIVSEKAPGKPEQVVPSLQGVIPPDFPAPANGQSPYANYQQPVQVSQSAPAPSSKPTPNWMAGLPPLPSEGPGGILYCSECRRPCSGPEALQYHRKKNACDPSFRLDRLGKNLCTHCGHGFTSNTGLMYHSKVGVCGQYSGETNMLITSELQNYVSERDSRLAMMRESRAAQKATQAVATPTAAPYTAAPYTAAPPQPSTSAVVAEARRLAEHQHMFHFQQPSTPQQQNTPKAPKVPLTGKTESPYTHLNPDALHRFQTEIRQGEEKYGKLMREALLMPEPERSQQMAKWKNCYNTRQSVTRKKYGIRLKEKRTQEEIDGERRRLLGENGPEKWMEMERSAKRQRTDIGPSSQVASPLPTSSSTPQPSQSMTPRKRVALTDMGGLSGSVGSAEMTDPTTMMTSAEPRGLTHLQQSQEQIKSSPGKARLLGSSQNEPMTIAEDSSSGGSSGDDSQSDTDMSTDSDNQSDRSIPAR